MYMTSNVPLRLQRIVRRARTSDKFWDDDAFSVRVNEVRKKLNARYPAKPPLTTGQYSGLTRSELSKTGTCETDWY